MTQLLLIGLALAARPTLPVAAADPIATPVSPLFVPRARSFPAADVRLLPGPFLDAQRRNERYLLSLDPDRLLHTFRLNVGLPTSAKPYGGWEEPKIELRGHSLGHYLSALALASASSGDPRFCQRAEAIVAELAKCQAASPGAGFNAGYLSAFPESFIDRVEARQPVWAPWYTLHKIMAGLLEVHQLCGNAQALAVVAGMADWIKFRVDRLPPAQMQASLDAEFGGMNEVLANLYAVTGNPEHLRLAKAFDHARMFDPLARGEDRLNGFHANTQIPKMIGAAREFELTGDPRYRDIARTFWEAVAERRSYVIGGHSDTEHFFPVNEFARHLSPDTAETCNTYNMLKLTHHLWEWEPSARTMDFYERGLYNHILASQDPATGMFVYLMSLKPGHFKTYSTPHDSFWCCVGTGMENHAKYADLIFAHAADSLLVNLFIPAELHWRERGVVVRQETEFPDEGVTRLGFQCAQPTELTVKIRRPGWAGNGFAVRVNGRKQSALGAADAYVAITRTWQSGDRLEVNLPLKLRAEPLPGASNIVALLYGPIVLAGELGREGMPSPYARVQTDLNGVPAPEVPVFVTAPGRLLDHVRRVKKPGASSGAASTEQRQALANRILGDDQLDDVLRRAEALTASGANAGSGYGEVWIRDLNTFVAMALRSGNQANIRSNLLTFFCFQGDDGNIPDGFIPAGKANVDYKYRRSPLAPDLLAHKNTVETDQETSLIQAIAKYVRATDDRAILNETIGAESVRARLRRALEYLMNERFDARYGLIWGATTADWGDVQPEHSWGVELDASSHRAIDIYDNAMLLVALTDYLALVSDDATEAQRWTKVREALRKRARRHLWDPQHQKFIPHIYLAGSPFPPGLDERAIHYHGGTAVAIEADLLTPDEVRSVLAQMRENVRQAGAGSIGLTVYPTYPEGAFKNPAMKPYSYQNGGDWCWFGGRMIQQLVRLGMIEEAYTELQPMVARVAKHGDFYEWWSRDNQPRGSARFRGSAGVLGQAIVDLRAAARAGSVPPPSLVFRTEGMGRPRDVTLIPFYQLHHQRYSVYWPVMTPDEFKQRATARALEEQARREQERQTVDAVRVGEPQSEIDHQMAGAGTETGTFQGRKWRHARQWFSYEVKVDPDRPVRLVCTWWGGDSGGRGFDIEVGGQKVGTVKLENNRPGEFYEESFPLSPDLTRGTARVAVKLVAHRDQLAGGLYGLRVMTSP